MADLSIFRLERLPHLTIQQTSENLEKFKRQVKKANQSPRVGEREEVAKNFEEAFERLETEIEQESLSLGIQPHLIFHLPLYPDANLKDLESRLEQVGLAVVSVEVDKSAVVAFRSDADLSQFRQALETYKTPREGAKSTVFDVFEWIKAEEMRSHSPRDRIGPKLAEVIGSDGENIEDDRLYDALDVELWARGTNEQDAKGDIREVEALIDVPTLPNNKNERVLDSYAGPNLCQARIKLTGVRLRRLLHMAIVAGIDFPPQPYINAGEILGRDADDFPEPPMPDEDGPRLCVLDSGIVSAHPLLKNNVGYEAEFLTAQSTVADLNGHGTRVAGIALYGDVRQCVSEKRFQSPITLYSGRILNQDAKLDEEKLFVTQIRGALELFTAPPYECRIYNLSFGRGEPWDGGKQASWGEALDNLAREYNVLFVVSSGNYPMKTPPNSSGWAEELASGYHACLLNSDWKLSDPATSALSVTVGSIAELDAPTLDSDIKVAVAKKNQPSPFSRCGPGVVGAMKPDFVDNGGNLVFQGIFQNRKLDKEQSVSVFSLNWQFAQGRMLTYDIGTSMAAPRVAHFASLVEWRLWKDFGERPHPNLVRAVMATAATIPVEAKLLFDSDDVYRACGYGRINLEDALRSRVDRVLLCAMSEVELDHFAIFRVPLPPELLNALGGKRITVALAFDPPVRKTRNDYLGVEMNFDLVRGASLDQIKDALRVFSKKEKDDDKEREAIPAKFKAELIPHGSLKVGVRRKRSTLQCATHKWSDPKIGEKYGEHEEWFVVVHSTRKWVSRSEMEKQSFAVAVVIEADSDTLYEAVRQRVQIKSRVQVRG